MALRNVQLLDSSVGTTKIAADTIIPADIDQTQAFNFSSGSGTFAGRSSGTISGTLIGTIGSNATTTGTYNFSSANSTFAGAVIGNMQGTLASVTVTTGTYNFSSAASTFAGRASGTVTGTLIGTLGDNATTSGTYNFSAATSTFAGILAIASASNSVGFQSGSVNNLTNSSTNVPFSLTMTSIPKIVYGIRSSSTYNTAVSIQTSTGSFAVVASSASAGTLDWIAII